MDQPDPSDPTALPAYPEETLAALGPAELIALLVRDEDRVPRNAIDACAGRGEAMVAELRRVLEAGRPWINDGTAGEWWLGLHAAMILGLIPGEQAGLLLIGYMRRMALEEDDNMQDWLAGYWPALFRNKPDSAVQALRGLCADRKLDWYVRANALEPVVANGGREGGALDEALDWAALIAADETEDWDLRLPAGGTLLDFAPARHRALLENLARRQSGRSKVFSHEDVQDAYPAGKRELQWQRMSDPWQFYRPGHIARRQERWADEDLEEYDDAYTETIVPPFVRTTPKIGRNEPCPCGSGKKYKKCCLARE